MKRFALIAPLVLAAAVAALALSPLRAEDPPERLAPPPHAAPETGPETGPETAPEAPPDGGTEGEMGEGLSLLERGAQMVLRGFLKEMEPKMDELQRGLGDAAKDLGPALDKLLTLFDDFRNYDAPERLPNGDIIIRRRPDAPPPAPLPGEPDAGGVTEL
ncbi:MAG: hypothetical protein R3D78_10000 [Paracoccaceae bacterium]